MLLDRILTGGVLRTFQCPYAHKQNATEMKKAARRKPGGSSVL
jgi:hypothetical protein